jgi:hypothetical protein
MEPETYTPRTGPAPERRPVYLPMYIQPDGSLRGGDPLTEDECRGHVPGYGIDTFGSGQGGSFTGYAFMTSRLVDDTGAALISGLAFALMTRTAMLSGYPEWGIRGVTQDLGLWSGWTEAVSTALLSDWDAPLRERGELGWDAWQELRREARIAHRQQQPLWRRRTGGLSRGGRRVEKRVVLLETQCGPNLTLRDVLAEDTCPEDQLLDRIPGDLRLARILAALGPDERNVTLALGLPGVVTWAEAAEYAGADDPRAFGERVRRKVRGLAAEQARRDRRRLPGPPVGLWQPGQEGRQS